MSSGSSKGNGVGASASASAGTGTGSRSSCCCNMSPVYLYYPNLIGYGRVFLALLGWAIAYSSWQGLILCYSISEVLDIFDGMVARKYNQCSRFGAILDMITDRLSTVGIFMLNAAMYPSWTFFLTLTIVADLGGHWIHMVGFYVTGAATHKKIPSTWSWIKWYYEAPFVMFWAHLSYEAFFVVLFVLSQVQGPTLRTVGHILLLVSSPGAAMKIATNFAQICLGSANLVSVDDRERKEKLSALDRK